jgi:class 3 adenylate cyclase
MDVGGWLRKLGLEQYEAAFRENKIDDTVLPRLTAEDLKDLGVGFVGDRRKLVDAIAALSAYASEPTPSPSDAPLVIDKGAEDTAERRQVTVMFSDLVGSTALSARMDPEDLREVISAYQESVAEAVRRFGGFVAKYMGDGVLIYFGYPQAHEDDAERAVRAGLQLIAAVTALKSPAPLQTRVGIATGLVVVGDLIGSGASQEQAIVGETPNLAARLQGIAEPNMVVIAEGTRRLLGNLFEFEDLGAKDLKGIAGPVRAWAAVRASSAEGRFEAMHPGGLTALVGREEELELLLRRWSRAKSGEGPSGTRRQRASHPLALFLLAAAYRQRALSDHWPDGTCRRICSRRHPTSEARQTRCGSRTDLDIDGGCRTLRRDAVAAKRWKVSSTGPCAAAAQAKNAGSADVATCGLGPPATGPDDFRGCALGRSDEPGGARSDGGPD